MEKVDRDSKESDDLACFIIRLIVNERNQKLLGGETGAHADMHVLSAMSKALVGTILGVLHDKRRGLDGTDPSEIERLHAEVFDAVQDILSKHGVGSYRVESKR